MRDIHVYRETDTEKHTNSLTGIISELFYLFID